MRLLHIDTRCKHMMNLMPSISATYQMEQEFHPYLDVEFLQYDKGYKPGYILQTKKGDIVTDGYINADELRELVWEKMLEERKIRVMPENMFIDNTPNNVIQGWKARKRLRDPCCPTAVPSEPRSPQSLSLVHRAYKGDHTDLQDREICKNVRGQECDNNYVRGSALYKLCKDEVNWLCNQGYPVNKAVEMSNKFASYTQQGLYDYLNKTGGRVTKQKFDEIISAGMFDDLGNRAGNKVEMFSEKPLQSRLGGLLLLVAVVVFVYLSARRTK